jgi:hypothetical protein
MLEEKYMKMLTKFVIITSLSLLIVGCESDEYEKLDGAWKGNIDCYKEKGIEFQEKSDGIYIKKSDKDDAIRYCS